MRNTLASLLLSLAAFVGTIALTAHMTSQTLLNPERTGTIVASVLATDSGRSALIVGLEQAGGTRFGPKQTAQLDQALRDPQVTESLSATTVSEDGTVGLGPARGVLVSTLKSAGAKGAASKVQGAADPKLPASVTGPYAEARDVVGTAARTGALAVTALIGTAIVISSTRGYVMRRAGLGLLGSVLISLILFKGAPMAISHFTDAKVIADSWSHIGAAVIAPLIIVGVIGVGLVVAGTVVNAGRRVLR